MSYFVAMLLVALGAGLLGYVAGRLERRGARGGDGDHA